MTMTKNASKKAAINTTTASPTDDALIRARGEVDKLNAAELRLGMAYRTKSDQLAVVRSKRGDQVLDSVDPDGAARESGRQVNALLQELDALADAARRARERRLAAIPAVVAAECDVKEARASAMELEANAHEFECDRLRAALELAADWGFVPAQARIDGQYVVSVGHGDGQFRVVDARGPKFMRIRADLQALRTQAAQGRFKVAQQAGSLEADSVEALVAAVHSDPMRIGPPVEAIIAWVAQAVEKEQRRRARFHSTADAFVPMDTPMRLHLEWRAGTIDSAQSHILTATPAGIEAE
jgi:hypothetical protein